MAAKDPSAALVLARQIDDPWYRAQALSWVAKYTEDRPEVIAAEACAAAAECDDDYKRSAVRAWEIAALAERECVEEARACLKAALEVACRTTPAASRCEALILLMHAAMAIDQADAEGVHEVLKAACPAPWHWRCRRALRDAERMVSGEDKPRAFFW